MLSLSRTLRFCLNARPTGACADDQPGKYNNFSAYPPMRGLGRYYELTVQCRGKVDPVTGYFINIKQIDVAFASEVLPWLEKVVSDGDAADAAYGNLLGQILKRLSPQLQNSVASVQLALTPRYNLTIRSNDMSHLVIRQQFEFSAAHRLHVPALSEEENRAMFGKCNNPAGHGHNYQLEVAVRAPVDAGGQVIAAEVLDELVDQTVIEKLDHKHLNIDVPEFESLNPSVENISKVIYELLENTVNKIKVELEEVRVWETGKTVCTYSGENAMK